MRVHTTFALAVLRISGASVRVGLSDDAVAASLKAAGQLRAESESAVHRAGGKTSSLNIPAANSTMEVASGSAGDALKVKQLASTAGAQSMTASMDLTRQIQEKLQTPDSKAAESAVNGAPDCSNCREPNPPANIDGVSDDTQCCVGLPTELNQCSEFIPQSVIAFVNNTDVTDSWRAFDKHKSIRCGQFTPSSKCDPCKVGTDYEYSANANEPGQLYCEPSEQVGRLRCFERTPDQFQLVCRPRKDNEWYGGWDVVPPDSIPDNVPDRNNLGYDQLKWPELKCRKR